MSGRQAKALTPRAIRRTLSVIHRHQAPDRDRVMLLLSARAGLRACEIAGLDWDMVLDARGRVSGSIAVRDDVTP